MRTLRLTGMLLVIGIIVLTLSQARVGAKDWAAAVAPIEASETSETARP